MKFGIRMPSIKKRISARISWKRYARHSLGLKMPRGMGILTDPKKFVYNKIYNKTSVSADKLLKPNTGTQSSIKKSGSTGGILWFLLSVILLFIAWPIGLALMAYLIVRPFLKKKDLKTNDLPAAVEEFEGQQLEK